MIGSGSSPNVGACIRFLFFLFGLVVVGGIALAQDCSQKAVSSSTSNETTKKQKFGNVKGTVSQDGKTLVSDDGKSWTIANPDAVKGHEGHHVELKGSADANSDQINIMSVKMLKGDKGAQKPAGPPVGGCPPSPKK